MHYKSIISKFIFVIALGAGTILHGGDGTIPLKLVGKVTNAEQLGFKSDNYEIVITSYKDSKNKKLVDLCGTAVGAGNTTSIDKVVGKAKLATAKFSLIAICHTANEDNVILFSKRADINDAKFTKFIGEINDEDNLVVGEMEILSEDIGIAPEAMQD